MVDGPTKFDVFRVKFGVMVGDGLKDHPISPQLLQKIHSNNKIKMRNRDDNQITNLPVMENGDIYSVLFRRISVWAVTPLSCMDEGRCP